MSHQQHKGPKCTRKYKCTSQLAHNPASVLQPQTHTVHAHSPRCYGDKKCRFLQPWAPAATPHGAPPPEPRALLEHEPPFTLPGGDHLALGAQRLVRSQRLHFPFQLRASSPESVRRRENPELSQLPLPHGQHSSAPRRQGLTHLGHLGIPGSPTSFSSSPAHKPSPKNIPQAGSRDHCPPSRQPQEKLAALRTYCKEPSGLPLPPPPPPGEQREGETVLWSSGTGFCSGRLPCVDVLGAHRHTRSPATSPAPCRPPSVPLVPPRRLKSADAASPAGRPLRRNPRTPASPEHRLARLEGIFC